MVLLPHSVTVTAPASGSVSGKPGTVSWTGSATADNVQITPLAAEASFDEKGLFVARAHLLLTKPASASLYVIGAKVVWGSRTFYVVRPPEIFTGIVGAASNCAVMIKEDK